MVKTLKNYEIRNIVEFLNGESGKALMNTRLPIGFAWKLKKNLVNLLNIYKSIEETLNEIRSQYADDEHSKLVVKEDGSEARDVKQEYFPEYVSKINEFLIQDNDVEISTDSMETLNNIDSISVAELTALEFMFEEEDK